jgi:hypothetical protein
VKNLQVSFILFLLLIITTISFAQQSMMNWISATDSAAWFGRYGHTSVVYDNKIWVIGGYSSTGIKRDAWYSTDGANWTQATSNAGWSTRYRHTSVVYDNKIWVIGGYPDCKDVWYSADGASWIRATANAGWSGRYGHTTIIFDNKIWVLGGQDSSGNRNDVWYSSDGVNWTQATANAGWSGRNSHTSIVFDNKMWVIGGWNNVDRYNDVWYSINGINWIQSTASAGWLARMNHTSMVLGGKIWIAGGSCIINSVETKVNDVWFSTDGANWTRACSTAEWSARSGHTSVIYDNKMWVIGGYSNNYMNDVWYSRGLITSIISPNGAEAWAGGGNQIVKWRTVETGFSRYRLLLSCDSGSTYPDTIAHDIVTSETTYNWLIPVLNLITCRVKVQILDSFNNVISEDASDANFTIDSGQPGAFNLISPPNSAWANGLPKFIWQQSADISISYYQLFIDVSLRKDSIIDTTYTLSAPQLSEGWHTWYIKAFDRVGNWRQSTQTFSVRIDTIPPVAFNLLSPVDSIWTTGSSLTYSWQASSDVNSGLLNYQLWINGVLNRDSIAANQTSTTHTGIFPTGTHTWQIRALDSAGNTHASNQTRILNIDITPPNTFNLSLPVDSVWIGQRFLRFTWQSTQDTFIGLGLYKLCMYHNGFGTNWSQSTDSAGWSTRRYPASVVFDNKIWVIGGYGGSYRNDVWYSNNGINWTQATASAGWSARYGHTSVVFNNKMWVIGGYDGDYKDDVWYSTDGVTWLQATDSAGWVARRYHSSVVFDNKMWVISGYGIGYRDDVWCSTNGINWTQVTASAAWSGRYGHTSVIFDNKMWVIGGYSTGYRNDVWFSTNGINWTQATASAGWSERRFHTSVVFDNKIWVIGGYDTDYKDDVWYSANGINWIQVTDSVGWTGRYGHSSVVFDNKIWVIGGYDENYKHDVWYLNDIVEVTDIHPPDTAVTLLSPFSDGQHLWEVIAYDSLGNYRNSNQVWRVNIDSTSPSAFNLISPADSALRQIPTPTLVWQKSNDLGVGFKKYELWIDDQKNIDSLGQNDTTTTPATLLTEGYHTWYVKAFDQINNNRNSNQTYTVILDWNLPDTFSLSSPGDNETTATQQPTLYWHRAHDSGSGIKKYQLWINGAVNRDSVPATDTCASPTSPLPNNTSNTWYVEAYDYANGIRSSNQTWHFITKDNIPPSTPVLLSPSNNAYLQDTLPRFLWSKSFDLTGVDHYQLQYAMNSNFIGGITIDVYDTTYQVLTRLADTTYYWRVKAVDFGNNWGSWSLVWQFEVDTRTPLIPTLLAPINGTWRNTSDVIFSWTQVTFTNEKIERFQGEKVLRSSNLESSNLQINALTSPVRYIMEIDTTLNFTVPLVVDSTAMSQDTINLGERKYFWRVRAYDLAGNQGIFSAKDSFSVDITAPSVPTLVTPDSGIFTNTPTITFKWRRSYDNFSGVKLYGLQYATTSSFLNPISLDSLTDTTCTSLTLADSTYYWRVRTKDKAGNLSNWSQVRSFRIYQQVPSTPILVSPVNGLITNNANINFIWRRSVSPVINYYILQYVRNSSFTAPDSVIRYDTTTVLTLIDSTYYWKVKAVDSAGNISSWSSVWSFEIDTRVPNIPLLVTPINGVWLTNTSVIFNWSQVNFENETANEYRLAKNKNLASLLSPIRYIVQVDTTTTFSNSITDTTSLLYDTLTLNQAKYFWRVRAYDLAGNQGAFSGRDSFGIDNTAPSVPNLLLPANNIILTDSFVTFVWQKSEDNVSGIKHYRIQVAKNANFNDPIDLIITDTTIILRLNDTTYYWRVKAIDRAYNESNWSTVRNFRVSTTGITEYIVFGPKHLNIEAYPNPTKSNFIINFSLPIDNEVSLLIYDGSGKLVKTLFNGFMKSGNYVINWNGVDDSGQKISQGIYFYTLKTYGQKIQKKMLILR